MNFTKRALENPAAVGVAAAILLLTGVYCLFNLTIQLFPNIEEPTMSIQTSWRAASPLEMESEILEPQEDVLEGLPGVKTMSASVNAGNCWINLDFGRETDMQQTLVEVISRLNRLPPLPRDANPPTIQMGSGGDGNNKTLTWFFIQLLPGNEQDLSVYYRDIEDIVKPKLEAVPGVSTVQIISGEPEELQIVIDPYRAAQLGIDIPTLANIASGANNVSGGSIDVGRRRYTIRFSGKYTPDKLGEMILDWRDGRPVFLGDIADIQVSRGKQRGFTIQNGNPAVSIRIDKESGANVLATLAGVKAAVDELRQGPLKDRDLDMVQSFDASVFINRAISLVGSNLVIGILLAVGILWWFLREMRATLIVAVAIPVSLLTTFIILKVTGRTLNVISLAGLAFASGMVLDAAIVVLENIVRLRERGASAFDASFQGSSQVWGALLASTATTVAIFLPVIFLKDVEGQLFADLALSIAIAVLISLFVAVTILPVMGMRFLQNKGLRDHHVKTWKRVTQAILTLTDAPSRRFAVIAVLMSLPLAATWMLLPKLDYLPPVKRDAVDVFFNFPPGANIQTIKSEIGDRVVERMQPYMDGVKEPALKNYYLIQWPGGGTIGARVKDQTRVKELEEVMKSEILVDLADTSAFTSQGNLFGGFGGNRSIAVHIQSRDMNAVRETARRGIDIIQEAMPQASVRPNGSLELAEPELRLEPKDQRIIEAGWNRNTLGRVVRVLGDGLYVGEYFDGEKRMDIILKSQEWAHPEDLGQIPLATHSGAVFQLGEMVDIQRTVGPSGMRRIDGRRTFTLGVVPPDHMTLEEAVDIIQNKVEPQLLTSLPPDGGIRYGGSADALKKAVKNMSQNFAMALIVLFLLMSALFQSLKDSLLVVLSIPLATVGGVAAIRILNMVAFQPLDLLTMIGFIILLGLVVNNAILLVHQTRQAERNGRTRRDAVAQALRLRMRPIFMSTATSIFGMLPLLLMPGVGSVIYRGLAAVIVGGMCVSTVFTLILLPSFLRLGETNQAVSQPSIDETAASAA